MILDCVDDGKHGTIAWENPVPMVYLPPELQWQFFTTVNKETRAEAFGQVFFQCPGDRLAFEPIAGINVTYTICRGSDKVYGMYQSDRMVNMWDIISVNAERVCVSSSTNKLVSLSRILVSAEYLQSITRKKIVAFSVRNRDVTIFHTGFPDVAPIITSYDLFVSIACTTVEHHDGAYSARTSVTLSDEDVKFFERFMDFVALRKRIPISLFVDEIPPAITQMISEFGITYETKDMLMTE